LNAAPPGDVGVLYRRALGLEWFSVIWNVLEAVVAIGAGVAAGSVALVGFGFDSLIEVTSAGSLIWRFRRAGPLASPAEQGGSERRALQVVGVTFFLLAAYVAVEAVSDLAGGEAAEASLAGLVLSLASLIVMPALAVGKQRLARALSSRALRADAAETWVCSYLSLALLLGVALNTALGWWWVDPVAALSMLPVIAWQGWETLEEARS
jgi:divalent metal cation (Fe/Co/Zn/Cd) transporter